MIFSDNSLCVKDELLGKFNTAYVRFFFHPSVQIELSEENLLKMKCDRFDVFADLKGADVKVFSSNWYPEFGRCVATQAVEIAFLKNDLQIKFYWDAPGA